MVHVRACVRVRSHRLHSSYAVLGNSEINICSINVHVSSNAGCEKRERYDEYSAGMVVGHHLRTIIPFCKRVHACVCRVLSVRARFVDFKSIKQIHDAPCVKNNNVVDANTETSVRFVYCTMQANVLNEHKKMVRVHHLFVTVETTQSQYVR